MKITRVRVWRVSPPTDVWLFVSMTAEDGSASCSSPVFAGWGEITGSGHDAAVTAVVKEAAAGLLGKDALDPDARLAAFRGFRYPPIDDKIATVAWSGLAQAMWDIRGQAFGRPLAELFGASKKTLPLYANLNRGLFRDRSPEAHARSAKAALDAGFAAAKVTPFDEIIPAVTDPSALEPALDRLRAVADSVDSRKIAIDCHRRFSPRMAEKMLSALEKIGEFRWIEDMLATPHMRFLPEFRRNRPNIAWAGGEELRSLPQAAAFLAGAEKPDIVMPDIKYICGLDETAAVCRLAESAGCAVFPHNPSGPVSQAFSAHMAACCGESTVEYPFLAVPDRGTLTTPEEPVRGGMYRIANRPGLGIAPSTECLDRYGTLLADAAL